ncbi:MAG: spore coat protein CotJB [Clostridia bacterium]|nr:spore coat protein CotJB [Clostridia bacterium]
MMMEDRKSLLKEIMALDFKLYDLALYLDTHPFDEDVLDMYQELTEEVEEKKEKYEKMYGPLTINNAAGECEWKWIENPWPWERMV